MSAPERRVSTTPWWARALGAKTRPAGRLPPRRQACLARANAPASRDRQPAGRQAIHAATHTRCRNE